MRLNEGLMTSDPTRKAIIKGKTPSVKKIKYLNQFELHTLLTSLDLKSGVKLGLVYSFGSKNRYALF